MEEVVQMKLTYHWEEEYLIPDLIAPESPHIGIWGERRRQFLRKHQKPIYDSMLMSGSLNAHLDHVISACAVTSSVHDSHGFSACSVT